MPQYEIDLEWPNPPEFQMRLWRCPRCGATTWFWAAPECCWGKKMEPADA